MKYPIYEGKPRFPCQETRNNNPQLNRRVFRQILASDFGLDQTFPKLAG